MMILRRAIDAALLWLAVVAALVCCASVGWWPGIRPDPDAAKPLPRMPMEVRGPSAKEVIEQLNRRGPEWTSPPDVVE